MLEPVLKRRLRQIGTRTFEPQNPTFYRHFLPFVFVFHGFSFLGPYHGVFPGCRTFGSEPDGENSASGCK